MEVPFPSVSQAKVQWPYPHQLSVPPGCAGHQENTTIVMEVTLSRSFTRGQQQHQTTTYCIIAAQDQE